MTQNEFTTNKASKYLSVVAEQCWQAVVNRDSASVGKFYYGVLTTGVYCRPGCPSKTAKREHVRFYASAADAERDGLRAGLRCRPLALSGYDPARDRILALCRYIEEHADSPL